MSFSKLSDNQFLSLGTWRKNGKVVDTTVWFAKEGKYLLVFSSADAGKVKRLRNSSRARVAPCTVSGKLLGDWIDVKAEIITDEAAMERAYTALRNRYGWKMLVTDFFSRVAGKMSRRVFIRITPATKKKSQPGAKTKTKTKTGKAKPITRKAAPRRAKTRRTPPGRSKTPQKSA